MSNFLCPENECLCRCDPDEGDYCHYSKQVAENQRIEINNKEFVKRLIHNAEVGRYNGSDYLRAAELIDCFESAIRETIEDNLHLADGEDCTLIKLKRAINYNNPVGDF